MGGNAAYFQYDGFSQEQFQEIINQYVPPWLFTLLNITSILLTIIYLIAWWKMFTKAGEEGWKISYVDIVHPYFYILNQIQRD